MRSLTVDETSSVSGGDIAEGAAYGGGAGTALGVIIGYGAKGTLSAAAVGGAGFGVIGAGLGAMFGLGYSVGTWINGHVTNYFFGPAAGSNRSGDTPPPIVVK